MADVRGRTPNHPGTLLREIVLPAMRVSIAQAAREMGISRQQLHKILTGKGRVTAEMAARLGKYCGNGPQLWLNMQNTFDLWHAQRALAAELDEIPCRAVG